MLWGENPPAVCRQRLTRASQGVTTKNWRQAAGLGLILGAVQFFLTLYGYSLPANVTLQCGDRLR
jgi:hypothetical protein